MILFYIKNLIIVSIFGVFCLILGYSIRPNKNLKEIDDLGQLKSNITQYLSDQIHSKKIDFASVYYRDLSDDSWFGINQDELFSPSSLIKVPLMMTYYRLAESDPSILTKEILNTTSFDPQRQNFQPEKNLILNQKYTVDELINRMIIYSDDQAYDLLNDQLEASIALKIFQDLGINVSKAETDPSGNILSVIQYAGFFRVLYNSSYLDKQMSQKALNLLSQIKFTSGLVAGVPQNIKVSHKFGERQYLETNNKQLHDCGIIYSPNKPYLICIMTRGPEFEPLIDTIKNISQIIYQDSLN